MKSKKEILLNFIKVKDYKKALKIAKSFFVEFNKEQQRIIQIAYECLSGKERNYLQLNIDTEYIKLSAINLMDAYLLKYEK